MLKKAHYYGDLSGKQIEQTAAEQAKLFHIYGLLRGHIMIQSISSPSLQRIFFVLAGTDLHQIGQVLVWRRRLGKQPET